MEDVVDIIDSLSLDRVTLLGHSLGAVVAVMVATVLKERVDALVCLDGLYPWPRKAEDAPTVLSEYIEQRRAFRKSTLVNRFKTLEQAVRIRTFGQFPVSKTSASLLVERALYLDGDVWLWRTDPRLKLSSPLRFSTDQAQAFVDALTCETHMMFVEDGIVDSIGGHSVDRFPNVNFHAVQGTHHFHMDGATDRFAELVHRVLT